MHYISDTWKILLLILIPAKYLKDVFYLSNSAANRGQILQRNPNLFHFHRLSWLSQPFEHPSRCLFDTAPLKTQTFWWNGWIVHQRQGLKGVSLTSPCCFSSSSLFTALSSIDLSTETKAAAPPAVHPLTSLIYLAAVTKVPANTSNQIISICLIYLYLTHFRNCARALLHRSLCEVNPKSLRFTGKERKWGNGDGK